MRNILLTFGLFAILALSALLVACEEKPADHTISQFDRPQDVALICFDDQNLAPLPIDCCRKRENTDEDCESSVAKLFAFVTQTTPGEVAVVDVEEQKIVDQDAQIPYNSFIPVGGQPNDIAATSDGKRVYTANYETGDISVIQVMDEETGQSVIYRPYLSPAASIDIEGPAAKMFLVKWPAEYRDRFILVTQPTLGRLSVVALDNPDDCDPKTQDGCYCDPKTQPDGCLLGYLLLNQGLPTVDEDGVETAGEEIHPWAIAGAEDQSVYVGSYDGNVIWDIQTEALIAQALALGKVGQIDPEQVLNDTLPLIVPNPDDPDAPVTYSTRALSLEPERRRWLYAVENQNAKVIAINLEARRENPEADVDIKEVDVSGKARTVQLMELEEEGDIGPFTFNGTFAVVSTSNSGIAIVDVDDHNALPLYSNDHAMRSAVDLRSDAGIPKVQDQGLTLTINDDKPQSIDPYLYFAEDGGVGESCEDDTDGFRPEHDKGVRFRCNPYRSKRETWTVTYGGDIDVGGVGVIGEPGDDEPGRWTLHRDSCDDPPKDSCDDPSKDFCAQEVYTAGSLEGYAGDVLRITSEPTPREGYEDVCNDAYDDETERLYRVVAVSSYPGTNGVANVLHIERDESLLEDPDDTSDRLRQCFGEALEYELRAGDQWIIEGSRSRYTKTKGVLDAYDCIYVDAEQSKLRVFPHTTYENDTISFRMEYGDEWRETGPMPIRIIDEDDENEIQVQVESELSFSIVEGYEEMYHSALGNNIMDIELTPDDELMLVDQAGQGLIFFDLLDAFAPLGSAVN